MKCLICILFIVSCTPSVYGAVSPRAMAKVVFKGADLVLTDGKDASRIIRNYRRIPYKELVAGGLDKVVDSRSVLRIAADRNDSLISNSFKELILKRVDQFDVIPGGPETIRLLCSDNANVVKGAVGELKRSLFFQSIPNVETSRFRHIVKTSLGKTDIDVTMSYVMDDEPLRRIYIESKEYGSALKLSEDMKLKIDKYAELGQERNRLAVFSAGEDRPEQDFMRYAKMKNVPVIYGGMVQQRKMLDSLIARTFAQ